MGIETPPPVYIDDLDSSLPGTTDPLAQADDHLRNIKSVLKQTFPNINGPVTSTQAELDAPRAVPAINSDGTNATFNTGIDAAKIKALVGVVEPAIASDGTSPTLSSGITVDDLRTLLQIRALDAYPVGSIYMSVNSTNPQTVFGGVWQAIAPGRVLVGMDPSDTDFDSLLEEGGEKEVTLGESELPAHKHDILTRQQAHVELFSDAQTTIREIRDNSSAGGSSSTKTDETELTGGGNAHNNLQPYLVVSMWKRFS